MIATLLLALVAPLAPAPPGVGGAWFSGDALIRIWADRTHGLRPGDRVKLYVRAETDGYLLVLHAEPSGRVRIVFPLDPFEDNYMRGGTSYELRSRGGRETFEVFDRSGQGTVLAAFSRDPFRFDPFVRGDHWDYLESETWTVSGDPEGHLLNLVGGMATGRYDYDVLRYEVIDYLAYRDRPVKLSLYGAYYRDHHHGGVHVSIHFGYPWFYYRSYFYPVYFYAYPVYYYPQPVFVAYWYDPFFDPFFPYRYRPVAYVVYYPRSYAYYATYYPAAYRYRPVPARLGAGVYTFKAGSVPPVIEPRRRPVLAEAVARRLAAPENFSSPAVRRTVVAERAVPQGSGELVRRRPGGVVPTGQAAAPGSGEAVGPRREPLTGGVRPTEDLKRGRERGMVEGRRRIDERAREPVAAPPAGRSRDDAGTLRRLVPESRRRSAGQREELGPAPAPARREELRDRAIPEDRRRLREPSPEGEVGRDPVPGRERPSNREWRLRVVPEREAARAAEPAGPVTPYRAARPAVPRPPGAMQAWPRAGEPSSGETRWSPPAVAAPARSAPQLVVPRVRPPQQPQPPEGGGRRRP